ncbi:MAG: folate family ECF transporter S component [Spiroplasma sp.]|nr:folate family ECF transporter S component [Spiroplasma sp.]
MVFLWLNIISGVIIAVIFFLIIIFDHKNAVLELKNIKLIVLAAFLIAISVFINTLTKIFLNPIIASKIFEIKLGNFALVLIGFFCGGILGLLSGIAADFLGLIIYSTGTPVLFFTLTSVIWCILPYYLVRFFSCFFYNKWLIYLYLPLTCAYTLLLITGTTPIVLKYMYDLKGWWVLYLPRIIKFPLEVAINSFLLIIVYRVFINSVRLNPKIYQITKNKKQKKLLKPHLVNGEGANDD